MNCYSHNNTAKPKNQPLTFFINNDKIYVTDFVKLNKGEENIWAQEDGYYKEIANLEKKEMPKIILGIILFILLWVGIVIFGFFWKP